jgi:hypothetical protein
MGEERRRRLERALDALRRLEAGGATLDDVLGGEVGRRWVERNCEGDREVAIIAIWELHPEVKVVGFDHER